MGILLSRKNTLRSLKCVGYADKRDGYTICPKCGCELITYNEYQLQSYYNINKLIIECHYYHSTNTERIEYDFLERYVHRSTFGADIKKTGKQFHCNNYNANFLI